MDDTGIIWIVMIRDVSHVIRSADVPQVFAALILDGLTGLTRALCVGTTAREACGAAVRKALTDPPGPLPPEIPSRVRCTEADAEDVRKELALALPDRAPVTDATVGPLGEAEDVFDSLLGHLAGRPQPVDSPAPGDWRHLYRQAAEYLRAEPWRRWSDAEHLDLFVRVDGTPGRYVAVVLGQEGIQHGLALHPGAVLPPLDRDLPPGVPPRVPDGSLMLWLDPPEDSPVEYVAKAARYGWPDDATEVPLPVAVTDARAGDIDRDSARRLTVGIAAVLAHDAATSGNGTGTTTGLISLDDDLAEYRIG